MLFKHSTGNLILIIVMLLLAPDMTVAGSGLIGWWKLNEGNGNIAFDWSGYSKHGTIYNTISGLGPGGSVWDTDPERGTVLSFDGNDNKGAYVSAGTIPPMSLTNNFTWAFWAKQDAGQPLGTGPGGGHGDVIIGNRDGGTQSPLQFIKFTPLDFEYYNGGYSMTIDYDDIPSGIWIHHAVVKSGTTLTYYRNGVISGTSTVTNTIDENPFFMGGEVTRERWRGWLSDVRIYNRALSKNEVAAVYASEITDDVEITDNPDKVLEGAYGNLRQFNGWQTNRTLKKEHAGEIATILLILAKAKEAKNLPADQVLKDYLEVIAQFPDSQQATEALYKVVTLDTENGLQYATDFLEKCADPSKTAAVYARLIKSCLAKSDSSDAEKYVKIFIDKYVSTKNSLTFMAQLRSHFKGVRQRQFDEIVEHNVVEEPNSPIWCAVFRQRIMTISMQKDPNQLIEMAQSIRRKFPATRLAMSATAVIADSHYHKGNLVLALEAFKPELFKENRPESAIIEDIDDTIMLFNANTLQTQGIDMGMVYQALAQHCHRLGFNSVAVHCYKQSAQARGFSLDDFEDTASEAAKQYVTSSEDEVWFWKGMLAAEDGDLMAAGIICERFLTADDNSILAAKAFHTLARARMQLGWYAEAKDALMKAKSLSPCRSVIELEQELARTSAAGAIY